MDRNIPSQQEESNLIQLRKEAYAELQQAQKERDNATRKVAEAQERFIRLSQQLGR